jgi:predicted O-methyltransferase YrrM
MLLHDRLRWGALGRYIWYSRQVPGWTRGKEAVALVQASSALPGPAVVVEIGSFLGCSAVLLAGARKVRGEGVVHCIDPFDASGDPFSAPIYRGIGRSLPTSLRHSFDATIRRAGLRRWVVVHQSRAEEVALTWTQPVDLLYLDGDQSSSGARAVYAAWSPFLKPGGLLALHNSRPAGQEAGHDGHVRLVAETVRPPAYEHVACVGSITVARKVQA